MTKKIGRPSKPMMLAINASIDGKKKQASQLVAEHKLNKRELQHRLELRDGNKYDLNMGKGVRKKVAPKKTVVSTDFLDKIDGRTKTTTLLRLENRIQELLAQKPKKEVTKVKEAFKNYNKKKQELEAMEKLIGI